MDWDSVEDNIAELYEDMYRKSHIQLHAGEVWINREHCYRILEDSPSGEYYAKVREYGFVDVPGHCDRWISKAVICNYLKNI